MLLRCNFSWSMGFLVVGVVKVPPKSVKIKRPPVGIQDWWAQDAMKAVSGYKRLPTPYVGGHVQMQT